MYKLSDVAIKLNIEKVYLFELLMTRSEILNDHVLKEYGVTYITDKGIRIIDDIINGRDILVDPVEEVISYDSEDTKNFETIDNNGIADKLSDHNHINVEESDAEPVSCSKSAIDLKNEKVSLKDEEQVDDNTSREDDEEKYQELDIDYTIIKEKTRLSFYERETKKKKILELRSRLIELDSEIRRKSEAIESYDKILEEDIQWICILEDKLAKKIVLHEEDTPRETSQRNLLDKLFMKK